MKNTLDEKKLLHVTDRRQWRAWLKKHYKSEKDIWLVNNKKHTGKPRIPYNDAVEEALSFGWIDSTARSIDADQFAQRFSPRKHGSPYSQPNKERLRKLVREGRVVDEVLATLENITEERLEIPPDILKAIKASKKAWTNFQTFSEPYKRIRIAYVGGARKRPDEFARRLKHFIEMTEKNKQFGFGGIEKYY